MRYMWQLPSLLLWVTEVLGVQGELFKGAALFAPMLSLERASHHGLNFYLRHVCISCLHLRGCSTQLACAGLTGLSVALLSPCCSGCLTCQPYHAVCDARVLGCPAERGMAHAARVVVNGKPAVLEGADTALESHDLPMMCPMYRPLAALLSWFWPTLPAASTTKNHLYPELQALWDQGTVPRLLLFI